MRYINERNKEPKELIEYRNTPGATYDGFREKEIVRRSLIEEQGYICAYCMRKIDIENSSIEHYISQSRHQLSPYSVAEHNKQSLLYSNMCGVCVNNSQHCDKKRGNIPILILDPHKSSCELLITYTIEGKVIPINDNNQDVINDIETLGLNCKKLIKERISVKDDIWKRFIKEHPKESWSEELFNTYSDFYYHKQRKKSGIYKYHAYCNYIAWFFDYYAKNYKHFKI